MRRIIATFLFIIAIFNSLVVISQSKSNEKTNHFLNGNKQVFLLDNKNKKISIGSIHFSNSDSKITYTLKINHELFKDYFLSMKEMKCLTGIELWCHLAYPYPNSHEISGNDFRWLSHDLLFMYKKKSDFGANFYNGIYYHFTLKNDHLLGEAMAIDLNLLAAPPEDLTTPPIGEYDIEELEPSARWLPRVLIQ